MQVSKTNSLITRGIAFVAAFAFAVTVFTPAIVSAQDASATTPAPATGFKANLTNKDTCIASFTANPNVAEVKKYGQERIDKRLATVEKLDKAVDKFYKERKSTYDDKADSIDVTLGRYADKDLKRKLPDADAHKKALNKNIADRKKLLKKFNGQLKEAGDQPAAIGAATCSAIIDGRIYNGLVAKYKQQTKLDRISMRNAINQARYDAAHGIKSGVKGMPNPEKNNDEIKSAQKLLNSDKSAQKEIDALEAKVIKKEAPDIAKDYKKVAADARAAKKAKQAAAAPANGGGATAPSYTPNGGSPTCESGYSLKGGKCVRPGKNDVTGKNGKTRGESNRQGYENKSQRDALKKCIKHAKKAGESLETAGQVCRNI